MHKLDSMSYLFVTRACLSFLGFLVTVCPYHAPRVLELESFTQYPEFDRPFVVRQGCNELAAINRWSMAYLLQHMEDVKVGVEVEEPDTNDMSMEFIDKTIMTFQEYYALQKKTKAYITEYNTINLPDTLLNDLGSELDKINGLRNEMLFVGSRGTSSAFHMHGIDDFITCIVTGKKEMFFFNSFEIGVFTSHPPINIRKKFLETYAKSLNASYVLLKPGDGVFIPPWWYHSAKNLDFTVAVTKIYARHDLGYAVQNLNIFVATMRSYFNRWIKYVTVIFGGD